MFKYEIKDKLWTVLYGSYNNSIFKQFQNFTFCWLQWNWKFCFIFFIQYLDSKPYWWDLDTEYEIYEAFAANITAAVTENGQTWVEPGYLENEDPVALFTQNAITEVHGKLFQGGLVWKKKPHQTYQAFTFCTCILLTKDSLVTLESKK